VIADVSDKGIPEISTGKITAVNAGHEIPVIRQPER